MRINFAYFITLANYYIWRISRVIAFNRDLEISTRPEIDIDTLVNCISRQWEDLINLTIFNDGTIDKAEGVNVHGTQYTVLGSPYRWGKMTAAI